MEWLLDPHAWLALATLTALEIVLGVDNIISGCAREKCRPCTCAGRCRAARVTGRVAPPA